MSLDDRIRRKLDIEAARKHPAFEPSSDPTPSAPATPYDLPVRDDRVSPFLRGPDYEQPSFGAAIRHFFAAAERMSKRITAVLAIVSMAGIAGSTALAYWVTTQGFIKQDAVAQINSSLRRIELATESQALTVKNMQDQNKLVNDVLFQHTQQLAEVTAPGKRNRK